MDDDSSFFVYNKWRNLDVTAIVKNCQCVSGLHLIVLTKLCLDAGNDFSIILCNFGGLLVGKGGEGGGGVKVIEDGLRSIPSQPWFQGAKKAS